MTSAVVVSGEGRGKCVVCGDTILQPKRGRKRLLCRKKTCAQARYRAQRRSYGAMRPYVWTAADLAESLGLWGYACGICRQILVGPPAIRNNILLVHARCVNEPMPQKTCAWLSRVVPGCPLPKVAP